jgi:O-antigen ligase
VLKSQQNFLSRCYLFLTALLIFLIPSNLFLKFAEQTGYFHGIFIDYLLPKLYVSDLVICALLFLWIVEIVLRKKISVHVFKPLTVGVLLFAGLFFLRQFFVPKPLAALWFALKLTEMFFLGCFFVTHPALLKSKMIWYSWIGTIFFQAFIGFYQFYTQQSFFPSYYFLGEIHYSRPLFLAKGVFYGAEKILAYGTTAHPNIFAGFLVLALGILLRIKNRFTPWLAGVFVLLILCSLFVSQSGSAVLCFVLLLLSIFGKKYLGFLAKEKILLTFILATLFVTPFFIHQLAVVYPQNLSFVRRDELNQAAIKMFMSQPLLGVGLNTFTVELEKYFRSQEIVRFVQPVHNVFLLWIAETGLIGIALAGVVGGLIWRFSQRLLSLPKILILLPLLVLDHYLLTQQSGLLILLFFLIY